MNTSEQYKEIAFLEMEGNLTRVSISYSTLFTHMDNICSWLLEYDIQRYYIQQYYSNDFNQIDTDRNIVIVNLSEREFFFTRKEYALLFKLTWGGDWEQDSYFRI